MNQATLFKIIRLAFRNLFRNKRRTLLTLLLAVIGFTGVAVSRGYYTHAVSSLQELTIRNGFAGANGTTHFQVSDPRGNAQQERFALEFGIANSDQIIAHLQKVPEFDYAMRRIKFGGLVANNDKTMPFIGYGIEVVPEARLREGMAKMKEAAKDIQLGEEISRMAKHPHGVLLGKNLARDLGLKVGDPFMLLTTTVHGAVNAIDVTLAGIQRTGAKEVDNYSLLTELSTAQQVIHSDRVSFIAVMFKNRDTLPQKEIALQNALLADFPGQAFLIQDWETLGDYYRSARDLFDIFFAFLEIIIIVIVIISCWNIVNMTTMERVREIGTLRAIGLSIKDITSIFLIEEFLIGIAGVVLGFGVQLATVFLINSAQIPMPPIPGSSETYLLLVDYITAYHPYIAGGIIAALTLSSLSSFFAIKRLSIIEALEHA